MCPSVLNRALFGMALATTVVATPPTFGALLLNYQFESVAGAAPTQTTPDSSGNFTSSDVEPLVNALLGFGTNTPGTDYPQQVAGPVANASVQSLNPANGMQFYGGLGSDVTRIQIDDDASGALDATFTNFTVGLWLNPSDTANDRFAIGKIGLSGNRGWQIYSPPGTNDVVLDYFATAESGTDRTFTLTGVLPLNTWTHLAFAFDGTAGTEAMYINGVAQSPAITGSLPDVPTTWNAANDQPFRVGHRGRGGSAVGGWIGGIDDVRVYDETLNAAQIQALMSSVSNPLVPGDFDGDNDVDGADFVVWQTNFPTATGGTLDTGDADGDGDVDGADFVVWQTNFPTTPGPGVAPVPEPHALTLIGIGVLLSLACRWKSSR